ncbi:MAG: GntR family transcriptional regulator [Promethearchaeota archaeon]
MISRDTEKPLYFQIADEIRSGIKSSKFVPGSKIPSETEMLSYYKVGRVTIRQALDVLVSENLIVRKQGLGSFVSDKIIDQELSDLKTITEVLLLKGVRPKIKVLDYKTMLAPKLVKSQLNLELREKVLQIRRLYLIRRTPLCLVTIYLPKKFEKIIEPLKKETPETETTYTLLERAGFEIHEARHVIKSISASRRVSNRLQVPLGTPILALERTTYQKDGRPIEFLYFQYRSDKFEFSISLPRKSEKAQSGLKEIVNVLNI